MGQNSSRGNEQIEISINHPKFVQSRVLHEFGKQVLKTIVPCDQKSYKLWKQLLEKYKSINHEYLLQPKNFKYKPTGLCASRGQLEIEFDNYPYLLTEEIYNRKGKRVPFTEPELWYLLYAYLSAKHYLHQNAEYPYNLIGDIRPENVFINQSGQVKFSNMFSWPSQKLNYRKTFDGITTYLSPQDYDLLQLGSMSNEKNQKSQFFSIGFTLVSAAVLKDNNDVYNIQKQKFDQHEARKRINAFKCSTMYSELIRAIISSLCSFQAKKRVDFYDLWIWITRYERRIMTKQPFMIDEVPAKINQHINNLRAQILTIQPESSVLSLNSIKSLKTSQQKVEVPSVRKIPVAATIVKEGTQTYAVDYKNESELNSKLVQKSEFKNQESKNERETDKRRSRIIIKSGNEQKVFFSPNNGAHFVSQQASLSPSFITQGSKVQGYYGQAKQSSKVNINYDAHKLSKSPEGFYSGKSPNGNQQFRVFIQYKSPQKPIEKPYAETVYVGASGKTQSVRVVQSEEVIQTVVRKDSDAKSQKSGKSGKSGDSNRQNRFIEQTRRQTERKEKTHSDSTLQNIQSPIHNIVSSQQIVEHGVSEVVSEQVIIPARVQTQKVKTSVKNDQSNGNDFQVSFSIQYDMPEVSSQIIRNDQIVKNERIVEKFQQPLQNYEAGKREKTSESQGMVSEILQEFTGLSGITRSSQKKHELHESKKMEEERSRIEGLKRMEKALTQSDIARHKIEQEQNEATFVGREARVPPSKESVESNSIKYEVNEHQKMVKPFESIEEERQRMPPYEELVAEIYPISKDRISKKPTLSQIEIEKQKRIEEELKRKLDQLEESEKLIEQVTREIVQIESQQEIHHLESENKISLESGHVTAVEQTVDGPALQEGLEVVHGQALEQSEDPTKKFQDGIDSLLEYGDQLEHSVEIKKKADRDVVIHNDQAQDTIEQEENLQTHNLEDVSDQREGWTIQPLEQPQEYQTVHQEVIEKEILIIEHESAQEIINEEISSQKEPEDLKSIHEPIHESRSIHESHNSESRVNEVVGSNQNIILILEDQPVNPIQTHLTQQIQQVKQFQQGNSSEEVIFGETRQVQLTQQIQQVKEETIQANQVASNNQIYTQARNVQQSISQPQKMVQKINASERPFIPLGPQPHSNDHILISEEQGRVLEVLQQPEQVEVIPQPNRTTQVQAQMVKEIIETHHQPLLEQHPQQIHQSVQEQLRQEVQAVQRQNLKEQEPETTEQQPSDFHSSHIDEVITVSQHVVIMEPTSSIVSSNDALQQGYQAKEVIQEVTDVVINDNNTITNYETVEYQTQSKEVSNSSASEKIVYNIIEVNDVSENDSRTPDSQIIGSGQFHSRYIEPSQAQQKHNEEKREQSENIILPQIQEQSQQFQVSKAQQQPITIVQIVQSQQEIQREQQPTEQQTVIAEEIQHFQTPQQPVITAQTVKVPSNIQTPAVQSQQQIHPQQRIITIVQTSEQVIVEPLHQSHEQTLVNHELHSSPLKFSEDPFLRDVQQTNLELAKLKEEEQTQKRVDEPFILHDIDTMDIPLIQPQIFKPLQSANVEHRQLNQVRIQYQEEPHPQQQIHSQEKEVQKVEPALQPRRQSLTNSSSIKNSQIQFEVVKQVIGQSKQLDKYQIIYEEDHHPQLKSNESIENKEILPVHSNPSEPVEQEPQPKQVHFQAPSQQIKESQLQIHDLEASIKPSENHEAQQHEQSHYIPVEGHYLQFTNLQVTAAGAPTQSQFGNISQIMDINREFNNTLNARERNLLEGTNDPNSEEFLKELLHLSQGGQQFQEQNLERLHMTQEDREKLNNFMRRWKQNPQEENVQSFVDQFRSAITRSQAPIFPKKTSENENEQAKLHMSAQDKETLQIIVQRLNNKNQELDQLQITPSDKKLLQNYEQSYVNINCSDMKTDIVLVEREKSENASKVKSEAQNQKQAIEAEKKTQQKIEEPEQVDNQVQIEEILQVDNNEVSLKQAVEPGVLEAFAHNVQLMKEQIQREMGGQVQQEQSSKGVRTFSQGHDIISEVVEINKTLNHGKQESEPVSSIETVQPLESSPNQAELSDKFSVQVNPASSNHDFSVTEVAHLVRERSQQAKDNGSIDSEPQSGGILNAIKSAVGELKEVIEEAFNDTSDVKEIRGSEVEASVGERSQREDPMTSEIHQEGSQQYSLSQLKSLTNHRAYSEPNNFFERGALSEDMSPLRNKLVVEEHRTTIVQQIHEDPSELITEDEIVKKIQKRNLTNPQKDFVDEVFEMNNLIKNSLKQNTGSSFFKSEVIEIRQERPTEQISGVVVETVAEERRSARQSQRSSKPKDFLDEVMSVNKIVNQEEHKDYEENNKYLNGLSKE